MESRRCFFFVAQMKKPHANDFFVCKATHPSFPKDKKNAQKKFKRNIFLISQGFIKWDPFWNQTKVSALFGLGWFNIAKGGVGGVWLLLPLDFQC